MLTFIGQYPKGKQINHKDTNKQNNRLDNLEYCTPKENTQHAYDNGLRDYVKYSSNAIKRIVNQYNKQGKLLKTFNSITEAAKQTNINLGNICSCCIGTYKSAGGYIWKYA